MKELTRELVREAFRFFADPNDDDLKYTNDFMELLSEFQKLDSDQVVVRAYDLKQQHVGKNFALLGGPILGVLNDVPKERVSKDIPDEHFPLRNYDTYFVVVNSKFLNVDGRQIVVLTSVTS